MVCSALLFFPRLGEHVCSRVAGCRTHPTVGISTPEPKIGTYREFTRDVLPRIKDLGYNTIQLM